MSRTKEIDVFVSDSGLKILQAGENCGSCIPLEIRFNEFARFKHKVAVTLSLPERKVEITESEFDEAVQKSYEECGVHWAGIAGIKEKLFGKDHQ